MGLNLFMSLFFVTKNTKESGLFNTNRYFIISAGQKPRNRPHPSSQSEVALPVYTHDNEPSEREARAIFFLDFPQKNKPLHTVYILHEIKREFVVQLITHKASRQQQ